ncbi:MAG: Asp-tRNA(Asn)/Glu-tRNA(Gln) amidotransferase GatCAB subunit A [Urechidicola sp.]|nr:Asp-tRNA(Asn)/Glu-tRNA(Gln) amidotransferase GatCAB subunit A [Urechidicola sp.]
MQKNNNQSNLSRRKALGLLGLGALAMQIPMACIKRQSSKEILEKEMIHYKTISEMAKMIKSGEISSTELTQIMLDRISTVDKKLNSYLFVFDEIALATAAKLDKELASANYRGPLHGIPISVKDLLYTNNAPTTGGHNFNADFVPSYNATVINKLQEAGAVILGKTNLTEGAMAGYHPNFKIPINPWGAYEPGESSSGSGVATAAGLCFGAIGTDTGGSIRLPALVNGIVGLKPTYGLVSRYGVLPLAESMDHVGPMTRSVEDAAIMLKAIAGYDPNDPTSFDIEVPDFLESLKTGIQGIRIGVDVDYITEGVEVLLSTSIQNAIKVLEDQGVEIVPIKIQGKKEEWDEMWYSISAKEAAMVHNKTYPSKKEEYGLFFQDYLEFGHSITEEQYAIAIEYRKNITAQFRGLFSQVDVVVSPSGGMPKVLSEEIIRGPMSGWDPYLQDFDWHFTSLPNLTGTPALTMPCGEALEGAPPGFQLMADVLMEPLLFRVGYAFEQATKWNDQHPNI